MGSYAMARRDIGCSWPCRWLGAAAYKPGRPLSAAASSRWPSPAGHSPALLQVCVEEEAKDRGHELEEDGGSKYEAVTQTNSAEKDPFVRV